MCVPCGPHCSLIYACTWGFCMCWKLSAAEQIKPDCCRTPAVVSILLTPLLVSCPLTTPLHCNLPHPVDCPRCSASRTSQQVVHPAAVGAPVWKSRRVGCEAGRGVRCVVVRLDQLWQMDGPPGLLLRRQSMQQTVHGAVETLALGVSLRAVRRRSGLLDVAGVAQLFHQTGLEVSSLVAVDPFQNTVPLPVSCPSMLHHTITAVYMMEALVTSQHKGLKFEHTNKVHWRHGCNQTAAITPKFPTCLNQNQCTLWTL